ncbi:MAG: TetR/AcrR family transcriptional regulator [Comamonadaceae bacterium]|nr:MAG: TetR/AcrR family transcriptional regulator [Comamonadaceae bacterium]
MRSMAKRAKTAQRMRLPSSRYNDLIHIATDLFARDGYERTPVRAISDAMGIESGSLYSHISSKEGLLYEIVIECADEFFRRSELARKSGGTAEQILRRLCHAHMSMFRDELAACQVYYDEWRKLNADHQEDVIAQRKRYEKIYRQTIADGIRDGSFGTIDPQWGTMVVLSALNWASVWYNPKGPLTAEHVADSMLDVIFPGLRAR